MTVSRRGLLASSAAAGLGLAAGGGAAAQRRTPRARLRLSSQEGVIPGNSLAEKLDRMERWGFEGLEVWGGGLAGRATDLKETLRGRSVKISAICAGFEGALISHDAAERQKAVRSTREILTAAGDLGALGMVVVPAFNGQTTLGHVEARKVLIDQLPALGEHAKSCGTRVLLEPLNRGEAWFLRQLADAAAICRDARNEGVCMMGDFYHMFIEEPNDLGAFLSGRDYLHHVHLASRRRVLPGQDERDFREGFRALKMIGYQGFCSLECGCDGDRETEIPKSVRFLRDQWAKA
ncbi:MAG TPA: sugar phosphate isomerase/epimerase family protein [Chthonomonadales bacterium]|nr:sugar phosphate isomerase/epimerase family protein [Chthonomonadales bacterium]